VELRHLRYFVAVAEELHFGKAAQRLHIVQPALSKQISLLEKELGVQLLERTKRHVQLTDAGTAFLEDARRTIAHAELAVERAHLAGRGETGVLRIGFIAPVLYQLLPRILRVYRTHFPGVRLRLREVSNRAAIEGVAGGHLDIAFVRLPIEDDLRLCCESVSDEPVVIALPADHDLAGLPEIDLRSLAGESFVMISRSQEPELYDHYVGWCLEAGFSPRVVHEVDRTHVAVGLVAGGLGAAFVPTCAMTMPHPGVVYLPLREPSPRLVMGALWRSEGGSSVLAGFLAMQPWSFPPPAAGNSEAFPRIKK
jgi:DNA-binding transcriptional LysR family regulator